MSRFEQNRRIVQRLYEKVDGIPGVTGRLNADGTLNPDPKVNGNPNRLYVRIGGERNETPVWNNGRFIVSSEDVGVQVRVAPNEGGELEIIAGQSLKGDISHGDADQTVKSPNRIGSLEKTVVPGRSVGPGRIRVWVPGTLKVNADAFLFDDTASAEQLWQPPPIGTDDGTCLNLSSSVPAAVSSVDYHRWVRIALNPTAGAAALVAFTGTAQPASLPLAADGYTDIALTAGYLPLDAVILTTGDTTEADIPETDWALGRKLLGTSTGLAVTTVSATATPTGIFDIAVTNPTTTPAIALSLDTQTANTFLGGPTSGSAAVPSFRTISAASLTTRWEPLANGDPSSPALVFDASGNVIMTETAI